MACDDGSTFEVGTGYGLYPGPVQEPARIDLDLVSSFDALHLHGRLGLRQGSGTLSYVLPALTAEEQAQGCRSGDLTWQVHRVSGNPPDLQGSRSARVVTTHPMPGVVRTIAVGVSAPADTGPPRHYRGRTSQGLSMRIVTVRSADGPALRGLDLNLTMTCDDGSTTEVGSGRGWFPGEPMTHARLDLDQADLMEALHVHGDLTIHLGAGTLGLTWPALNAEEQPQLCAARDMAWTAWRTDPGQRSA